MSPNKILVIVQKRGLFGLIALTALAFILACAEAFRGHSGGAPGLWASVSGVLYSEAKDATGWAKVMHNLFTAAVGWAAARVYMSSAGFSWDNFYARRLCRNHVVIVAGRTFGSALSDEVPSKAALAIDIALSLAAGAKVVLCLSDIDEGARIRLWEAGVTLVKAELTPLETLEATSADKAQLLIAMRDSFGENIALTRAALSPALGNPELQCRCMVEPVAVLRSFRVEDYLEPETLSRVRVFNESELIARRVVRDFPPDTAMARSSDRGVHVLLVGLGSVGQALLLQLARMGHFRSGIKLKATVVDRKVKSHWKSLVEAYPALEQWVDVELRESQIEQISDADIDHWLRDEQAVSMVYACTKDEIANLRIARAMLAGLDRASIDPAPGLLVLDPPGGCVLGDLLSHGYAGDRLRLFSLLQTSGSVTGSAVAGGLMAEMDDDRARRLHEDYCAKNDAECAAKPGTKKGVANRPWEILPETYRNANRMSADHLDFKLRAVGRRIAPKGTAPEAPLSADELELLSRMEHQCWWANRALDGWRYSEIRNDALKLHPSMVPYDQLTEAERAKDRNNVLASIDTVRGEDGILADASP